MTGRAKPSAWTRRAVEPFVGIRVRRLHGLIQAQWAAWIASMAPGLTPAQGGTLLLVRENPGINQGDLAALLGIEAPSLSQILSPLVRRQFIERRPGVQDRRVAVFSLTPAGEELAVAIAAEGPANEARLMNALSPAEQQQLMGLLDRVLAARDGDDGASASAPPQGPP